MRGSCLPAGKERGDTRKSTDKGIGRCRQPLHVLKLDLSLCPYDKLMIAVGARRQGSLTESTMEMRDAVSMMQMELHLNVGVPKRKGYAGVQGACARAEDASVRHMSMVTWDLAHPELAATSRLEVLQPPKL